MRLSLRTRLFLTSIILLSVVGLSSGAYLEHALRQTLQSNTHQRLTTSARLIRQSINNLDDAENLKVQDWDALADDLAFAAGERLTIIAKSGKVLGDSEIETQAINDAPNHGDRPEVRLVLVDNKPLGQAERFSKTMNERAYYIALPYSLGSDTQAGVARISTSITSIEEAVAKLHQMFLGAGLIGLIVAIFMSLLASSLFSRTANRLIQSLKALAEGSETTASDLLSEDEFEALAAPVKQNVQDMNAMVLTVAEERNRFQSLLEVMREGIIVLDKTQHITLMNSAAVRLFDLGTPKVGQSLLEVIRIPALYELINSKEDGDEPLAKEFTLGTISQRSILAQAVRAAPDGGTVISLYDVTNMRKLERMRTDFMANVSHELRTPASIILANAETLIDGAIDERDMAQVLLEAMMRNAERLARLLSDLMDISRLESGQQSLELEEVDLGESVEDVVRSLAPVATKHTMTLVNQVSDAIEVVADQKALDQVLHNLISNAVKYSNPGCEITIRAMHKDNRVIVEIEDNGPGIAPTHQSRLFERFYRVDPGRSRDMGGTGLGLAIVKHLTGAMGGEVGMRSASPRGSIFFVSLQKPV